MGVKLNALLDQGSDYVEAVVDIKDIIGRRDRMPLLKPDFIFYMYPMGRKYAKSLKILHNFTLDVSNRFALFLLCLQSIEQCSSS